MGIGKSARSSTKIAHRITKIRKLFFKRSLSTGGKEIVAIDVTLDIRYEAVTARIMRIEGSQRTAKERIFSVHRIHRKGNDRRWTDRDIGLINGIRVLGCDDIQ